MSTDIYWPLFPFVSHPFLKNIQKCVGQCYCLHSLKLHYVSQWFWFLILIPDSDYMKYILYNNDDNDYNDNWNSYDSTRLYYNSTIVSQKSQSDSQRQRRVQVPSKCWVPHSRSSSRWKPSSKANAANSTNDCVVISPDALNSTNDVYCLPVYRM